MDRRKAFCPLWGHARRGIGALIVALCVVFFASALTYVYQGSSFSGGSFNDTLYNESGGFVFLNWTDSSNTSHVPNGSYTSSVMDYGGAVRFTGFSWSGKPGTCPENMSYIDKLGGFCIDKYEASVPGCDIVGSNSASYNASGYVNTTYCIPVSGVFGLPGSDTGTTVNATTRPGVAPLVGVSAQQARQMCANAGKHLCSTDEWLAAANILGVVYYLPSGASGAYIPYNNSNTTANCNTNSFCQYNTTVYTSNRVCMTGNLSGCRSSEGVYDLVGNVYEWVNETVASVIAPGPVSTYYYINSTSMNWSTTSAADDGKYGKDGVYFLGNTTSGRAVLRGGFWGTGATAGVFYATLNSAPSDVGTSIGFRCCSVP